MAFKMKGFEPHNMYKTKKAKTKADHDRLKKEGYDHSPYDKKVSWEYGGKTYHGDLIPSKETSTHRYARTHNGKIKSLPKSK